MPFIKDENAHKCKLPGVNKTIGTGWYCPVCMMIYRLEDDQRNGPYWIATGKKYTDPKMPQ